MNTPNKPTVLAQLLTKEEDLVIGCRAYLLPKNHPNHRQGHSVSNTSAVFTSKVVAIDTEQKTIETRNTIYHYFL